MAKLQIFTYEFSYINCPEDRGLFKELERVDVKESRLNKQKILDDYLHYMADEGVPFKKGKKEYKQIVVWQEDGIWDLRIANNKKQKIEHEFIKKKIPDNPSCAVFIDNRKDVQTIAIQKLTEAFYSPVALSKIMMETFNLYLAQRRLKITIAPRFDSHEFWKIVTNHPYKIKMVNFKFPFPNLPVISDLIGNILDTADDMNGAPRLSWEANDDEVLTPHEGKDLLNRCVKACAATGSEIKLKLTNGTNIICGENGSQEREINDEALSQEYDDLFDSKCQMITDFLNSINLNTTIGNV
ncbi:hypothetical protein [Segatella paludivivens]|uniref:hypothetical protein n=1 Tax=Segatella paludivivens TaxID=185294 RepID=UPI00036E4CE1|nr:hypothetical protein [Segatella paludivivens]